MIKTPLIAAALGLTMATLPVAANAAPQAIKVEYRDLDLSSADGQKALDRRIAKAAEAICESNEVVTGTRVRSSERLNCVKEAKASVKKQVAAKIEKAQLGG